MYFGAISSMKTYPIKHKSTAECHASTIVETPSGLVAAWFAGTHEGNPDVGIWISRQNRKAWLTPREVANGIQSPEKRYACWNPVLFYPIGGPLMLFYKIGPTPDSWWGMLITSNDHGYSWSEPRKLGEDKKIGHILGPIKNKPIQLEDGSILCPSSTEGNCLWRAHCELTKDKGKSWEVIGPINDGQKFGVIQPTILRYPEGRMQMLCRSLQGVIVQSWSDDGQTWSNFEKTTLPNPNSGLDAVTLKDGRQLLIYNNTTIGRSPLNVAVSLDGYEWKDILVLEDQKGEFSYPAVIQSSDEKIHITYTYLRIFIKHVIIDPEEL
jgi:predicted neuraminidase